MSSLTTKIKKLKGLKMDEISVRVAQRVAILSERSGWSRYVSLPTDERAYRVAETARICYVANIFPHITFFFLTRQTG